jgi:Rho-binding antiterminator
VNYFGFQLVSEKKGYSSHPVVMKSTYQPIDGNYYDIRLAHATKRTTVEIEYESDEQELRSISETIKDVYTKNGEEFMLLSTKQSIRLDKIISVAGVVRAEFGNGTSCEIR